MCRPRPAAAGFQLLYSGQLYSCHRVDGTVTCETDDNSTYLAGTGLDLTDITFSVDTTDGGGGTFSTGGDFSLGGTVGQHDAGVMSGGEFTLAGGFWGGGAVTITELQLYLPLIKR